MSQIPHGFAGPCPLDRRHNVIAQLDRTIRIAAITEVKK